MPGLFSSPRNRGRLLGGFAAVLRTCLVSADIALLAAILMHAAPAPGGVLVLDNHTTVKIDFTIRPTDGKESRHSVAAGDVVPVAVSGPVEIGYFDGQPQHHLVKPNNVFYFLTGEKPLELIQLALPPMEGRTFGPGGRPARSPRSAGGGGCRLYDPREDPGRRPGAAGAGGVGETHSQARGGGLGNLRHHCRVRFQVVSVDSWVSDPKAFSFDRAIWPTSTQKVRPAPARLAIGFTGRFQWLPGERHAGCTRTPLYPYILIRESLGGVSEAERLEFLVHENGTLPSRGALGGHGLGDASQAGRPAGQGGGVFPSASTRPTPW